MKIHKLTIENINCIVGKWEIDFDKSNFAGQNIFAVTGPVGSGKSTVLDSICLALYGETSRCAPKTLFGTDNVINVKQNAGRAEIMFTIDDITYISSWSQRKNCSANMSLKKKDKDSSEFVLESDKVKETKSKIEKIFGMKFKQFTQAILLAQGEFRRFFSADAQDRAELLGNITGKLLYQQLPAEASKKMQEVKQRVEDLRRQSDDPNFLSEEVLQEKKDRLQACQARNSELENCLKSLEEQLNIVTAGEKAEDELLGAEHCLRSCQKRKQEAAPQFELLEAAERADKAKVEYIQYLDSKERLEQCQGKYSDSQKKLTVKEADYELAGRNKRICEINSQIWNSNFPHVGQVCTSSIDKARTLEYLRSESAKLTTDIKELINDNGKQQNLIQELVTKIRGLQEQADQESRDLCCMVVRASCLAEHFLEQEEKELSKLEAEICDCVRLFSMKEAEIDHFLQGQSEEQFLSCENDLLQSRESWNELQSLCSNLSDQSEQIKKGYFALVQANSEYEDKLKQKSAQQHHLEQKQAELAEVVLQWEKARDIDELAKYRHLLWERGGNCPLCGSDKHPYLADPKFDELYRADLERAAAQKEQLEQAVHNCESICQKLSDQTDELYIAHRSLRNSFAEKIQMAHICVSKLISIAGQQAAAIGYDGQELQNVVAELVQAVSSWGPDFGQDLIERLCQAVSTFCGQVKNGSDEASRRWQFFADNRQRLFDLKKDKESLSTTKHIYEQNLLQRSNFKRSISDLLERLREKCRQHELSVEINAAAGANNSSAVNRCSDSELGSLEIADAITLCLHKLDEFAKSSYERNNCILQYKTKIDNFKERIGQNSGRLESLEQNLSDINCECSKLSELLKAELNELISIWSGNCDKSSIRKTLPNTESEITMSVFKSIFDEFAKQKDLFKELLDKSVHILSKAETEAKMAHDNLQEADEHKQEAELQYQAKLKAFNDKLLKLGFDNEIAWHNKYLTDENKIVKLRSYTNKIDNELMKAQGNREAAWQKWQQAKAAEKAVSSSKEELENKIDEARGEVNQIQQEIGAISLVLDSHQKAKTKKLSLVGVLNEANQELAKWERLCKVLGPIKGQELNKFVQSLTFRILLAKTNDRLQEFTDRYELQVKADNKINKSEDKQGENEEQIYDQGLNFEVIDKYQSVVRGSGNLSGGESFLVSLSMALALSDLASRKRNLNSLFLDEGFGTLDSETLSVVLSALDKLGSSDKMIGIVSHVAEVKDNIAVQLELERSGDGTSRLVGHNMEVALLRSAGNEEKRARTSGKNRK
ncbi:MAG: AAA family ATPase [Candidatus Bruticola sp.]